VQQQKMSSCESQVDESSQIPLGEELAANVILLTKINRLGATVIVSSELIDVTTGRTSGAATVKTDGSADALTAALEEIAARLTGGSAVGGGQGQTVIMGSGLAATIRAIGGESGGTDGVIKVSSEPPGARIWIDGRQLAQVTPCDDFVKLGRAKVKVGGLASYKDFETTLELRRGTSMFARLEPITGEAIVVARNEDKSLAMGVDLYVDGKKIAKAPVRLEGVLTGDHVLYLADGKGRGVLRKVRVEANKVTNVELSAPAIAASILASLNRELAHCFSTLRPYPSTLRSTNRERS
jgi:hypothetical protein